MTVTAPDGLFTFGTLETVERQNEKLGGIEATNDATPKAPLGVLYRHGGKVYRYVKHSVVTDTTVLSAAKGVAHWRLLDPPNGVFTVSSDKSDSIGGINTVAGIYGGVVTNNYYTWIGVGGVFDVLGAAGTVAGDKLIGSTVDLHFGRIAAGTAPTDVVYGVALATIDPTALNVKALLQNLLW